MIDMLIIAGTGIAAMLACIERPCVLSRTMIMAWFMSVIIYGMSMAHWLPIAYLPGAYAITDLVVAMSALAIWTQYHSQRARIVLLVSVGLMFCHLGFSASHGAFNWTVYALTMNVAFFFQCWTAGGGCNGLVGFLDNLWQRNHRNRHIGIGD